jgi:hypothetical protein
MLKATNFTINIKNFMVVSALLGALLLFAGAYAMVAGVYDSTVRNDAKQVSEILAGQTFDAMFQVMRKGWKRSDVEQFINAIRSRFADTPYSLEIYRGPLVEKLFGAIKQPKIDEQIHSVFAEGKERVVENDANLRHIYPLRVGSSSLQFHVNSLVGSAVNVAWCPCRGLVYPG